MEGFLKLGFFTMADKVVDALGKTTPFIFTGAVIAAIWIYFLFLVPKQKINYNSFRDYIVDVLHFRVMLACVLAKILYIASAIVLLIIGIVAMIVANFMVGLVGTVILQIVLRVLFEIFMVLFSIQENIVAMREERQTMEVEAYYDDED
jgi:hypothetical protein